MTSPTPVSSDDLHRHPGAVVDRLAANATMLRSSARSVQDLERQLAVLEDRNHRLREQSRQFEEHARFQLHEVEHRLTNTFATVQALVMQTACPGDTGDDFRASFGARLLALAHSHSLLGADHPNGAPLHEVVGRCLQPFAEPPGRISVAGDLVHLPVRYVPVLGLVFHELTTNAAKHGALSIPEGTLTVSWRMEAAGDAGNRSVVIVWRETDGPPVTMPKRRGFGSRLLEQGLARGANGTVHLDFAPAGLTCRICLSLASPTENPASPAG